jgi:hypothetical protein
VSGLLLLKVAARSNSAAIFGQEPIKQQGMPMTVAFSVSQTLDKEGKL